MGGAQSHAPDYSTGLRAFLSNYRTRLFLSILLVVAWTSSRSPLVTARTT